MRLTIKTKLFVILAVIGLVLGLYAATVVWDTAKARRDMVGIEAAVENLYAAVSVRRNFLRQVKSGRDYLISGEPLQREEFVRYGKAAQEAFKAWGRAQHAQTSLGPEGDELDQLGLSNIRAKYEDFAELHEDAFAAMDRGDREAALALVDEKSRLWIEDVIVSRLDAEIEDSSDELMEAFQNLLLSSGLMPWVSASASRQIRHIRSAVDYFLQADVVHTTVIMYAKSVADALLWDSNSDVKDLGLRELEARAAIRKWKDTISTQIKIGIKGEREDSELADNVNRLFEKAAIQLRRALALDAVGRAAEVRDVMGDRVETLLDEIMFAELDRADLDGREKVRAEHKELASTVFMAGVYGIAGVLAVAGFVLVITLNMIRGMLGSVREIKRGARIVGGGDLTHRITLMQRDELGELASAFNTMATDLQHSRGELLAANSYTDNILRSMLDVLIVVSPDGYIKTVNSSACALLGYAEGELVGQFVGRVIDGGKSLGASELIALVKDCDVMNLSVKYVAKGGRRIPMAFAGAVMRDETGKLQGMVFVAQDITEHIRLEGQLRQSQKMEAIGQLAGGVAHDFNNILTAIMGYISILKMKMDGEDPLRPYVEHIESSSERAATLTRSLLAFSRKQIINPVPVDLNSVVQNLEKLLSRLIEDDIDFRCEPADEQLVVLADSGQIEQVLMNLSTNARDAMPDGGHLCISTGLCELDAAFVKSHGYGTPGRFALLNVSDSGFGMDQKTKARIFEPFFTTKDTGKGTGLGLSMVYGIVKQHDGYISIYSEPGRGTTFKIYFPLADAEANVEVRGTLAAPVGGRETILVAEDDEDVREMVSRSLSDFGYMVIEAEDGAAAVERFADRPNDIDMLLLDVIMPRKNGKEAYEAIKLMRPGVKVLFMSGYTADIMHQKGVIEPGINFISKPLQPDDLLRAVRSVLDSGDTVAAKGFGG